MVLTTHPFLCRAAAYGKFGECLYFNLGNITDALFVYLGGEPEKESISVLEEQFMNRPLVCLTKSWDASYSYSVELWLVEHMRPFLPHLPGLSP